MKVFVAGATGAVGRRLVPMLVAAGHDVTGMTRTPEKSIRLRALGAASVVADALDRPAVMQTIAAVRPDVIVHQLTGLSGIKSFKKLDEELALTNRLRTDGTDNLLAAARANGVRRVVAQSYGLWRYENPSNTPHTEEDGLDPEPPPTMRRTLDAIRHLEHAVTGDHAFDGLVLRYGFFYGPGAGISEKGGLAGAVRARKMPVIGNGGGVWSFVHVDDAAAAAALAVDHGASGVYNVADDAPAPVREWIPDLAEALGSEPPRHMPAWVGRLVAGRSGVYLHSQIGAMSNAKAKRELGWRPSYATTRVGFRTGLGDLPLPGPVHHDHPAAA